MSTEAPTRWKMREVSVAPIDLGLLPGDLDTADPVVLGRALLLLEQRIRCKEQLRVPDPRLGLFRRVGLGVGRRALDELNDIAQGKKPQFSSKTLAQSSFTQIEFARAEATLRSAQQHAGVPVVSTLTTPRDPRAVVGSSSCAAAFCLRLPIGLVANPGWLALLQARAEAATALRAGQADAFHRSPGHRGVRRAPRPPQRRTRVGGGRPAPTVFHYYTFSKPSEPTLPRNCRRQI